MSGTSRLDASSHKILGDQVHAEFQEKHFFSCRVWLLPFHIAGAGRRAAMVVHADASCPSSSLSHCVSVPALRPISAHLWLVWAAWFNLGFTLSPGWSILEIAHCIVPASGCYERKPCCCFGKVWLRRAGRGLYHHIRRRITRCTRRRSSARVLVAGVGLQAENPAPRQTRRMLCAGRHTRRRCHVRNSPATAHDVSAMSQAYPWIHRR